MSSSQQAEGAIRDDFIANYSNLSSSGKEAMRRMMKIINSFLARPDSGPFREPVDWRGLELYDYPEIIKKQMDLGTVKRKLERGQYDSAAACAYDIRLVWKNCMTYNLVGSDFWLLAKGYSKRFEDRYRRIRNEYDVGEEPIDSEEEKLEELSSHEDEGDEDQDEDDEDEYEGKSITSGSSPGDSKSRRSNSNNATQQSQQPPKLDIRAKFAANLLLLNGIHLGHVIHMLEKKCPAALEYDPTIPDKMEVIVDKIEPISLFNTLSQYATEKAIRKRPPPTPKIEDVSNRRKR